MIQKAEWMDDETQKNAIIKAKYMASYIGYPDELYNDTEIEALYQNITLLKNNLLESIYTLDKLQEENDYKNFRTPYDPHDWKYRTNPTIVNAQYSSIKNAIQMPAGILQGNFFNKDLPEYINYGTIGMIIGHEITHGFDDKGRQFDKDGNLIDWWKPETKIKFLEKSQCVINQYNNYTVQEVNLNINGHNTVGENLADIGGVKEAYLAYLNWSNKNKPEPRLIGLDHYSPNQMFWISAANSKCKKIRIEALKNMIINSVHSPSEFRVIGAFSNMPEFARDFKCSENSSMVPKNRCEIW